MLPSSVEGVGVAGRQSAFPPRWFVVAAWHVHRWIVRASGGTVGTRRPRPGKWGALRPTTRGRRSGEPRKVIVGYFEDGLNLVSMAMNGWGAPEPAWWLNLQAEPRRSSSGPGGSGARCRVGPRSARSVRALAALARMDKNLHGYAARRPKRWWSSSSSPGHGGIGREAGASLGSDVGEHRVQRARGPREIERLDQQGCESIFGPSSRGSAGVAGRRAVRATPVASGGSGTARSHPVLPRWLRPSRRRPRG